MRWLFLFSVCLSVIAPAQENVRIAGGKALTMQGDLSVQMVAGIEKFLLREIDNSVAERKTFWKCDFSSRTAYENSVQPNRERFGKILGAVDRRLPIKELELVSSTRNAAKIYEIENYVIFAVRWPVFENVFGEGFWLRPKKEPVARIIDIPDSDQTPEMLAGLVAGVEPEHQFARRLVETGCEVLVPTLISREITCSGSVSPDEWVAYEFAKVRRLYDQLGIPDRAEIEYFNGPHTINGVGTFQFLHQHLNWPER